MRRLDYFLEDGLGLHDPHELEYMFLNKFRDLLPL